MLQQEFEERTKMTVTPEEYKEIEGYYNAASNQIDKDLFCKEWKKYSDSFLLKDYYERIKFLEQQVHDMQEFFNPTVNLLLRKADEFDDKDLKAEAIAMVGLKEVIVRKIKMSLELDQEDKKYIANNLR